MVWNMECGGVPLTNLPSNQNILLVHAGDDPGIIINRDLVNLIAFGEDSAFSPISASIIDPLTYIQYSGNSDIWASGVGAIVQVDVQPNNINWSPSPAQAAASIAASGIATAANQVNGSQNTAIVANQSQIAAQNSFGIPAGSTSTSALFNVNNLSFEFVITGTNLPIGDATPYALVVLQWVDSISGLTVAKDSFTIILQSQIGLNVAPHLFKGPNKGDQVKVTVFNASTAQAANFTYTFLTSSRTIPTEQLDMVWNHRLDNANSGSIPYTARDYADSQVLATFANGSLGVGATDNWVSPPHNGPAWFNLQETGVGGVNISVAAFPLPGVIYGTTPWLINDIMVTGNPNKIEKSLYLPMGPVQWQIHNGGSVPAAYGGLLVATQ